MKWSQPALLSGLLLAACAAGFGQGYQVVTRNQRGHDHGHGQVVGPVPHLVSMPIFKDQQICDPDSAKTRDLERLVIGPQQGVANTVVFLEEHHQRQSDGHSRGAAFSRPEALPL